jgi:hypothetical protein
VQVENITKLPYTKIAMKEGIIFSTYAALLGSSKGKTRLDQILTWMGDNKAEGCIMFDESHKAKNLFPESEGDADTGGKKERRGTALPRLCPLRTRARWSQRQRGGLTTHSPHHRFVLPQPPKRASTKMAQAVSELQKSAPLARVVYCSATGASSLGNMAYMERLGLWGVGTSFHDFNTFKKAITDGGVGAMELVALDMKRRGM